MCTGTDKSNGGAFMSLAQAEFRKIDKYIFRDRDYNVVESRRPGKFKWESAPTFRNS